MGIEEWVKSLIGKKVSVLLDGYRGKEAYSGILSDFDGEWLVVQLFKPEGVPKPVLRILCRLSSVISIWEYFDDGG